MNAHFALNFFCLLALLHGAESQMKTKPTRLTGQSINNFTIPIAPLDQCFPYEESKTFGLEFRLPRTGGQCDIGILICYPSTLATHSLDNLHTVNGLSVNSELFNVDNTVNNMWANECKGLLTGNKKIKDKATWHGIEVNTVKKSDGTSVMKLSTSLIGVGNEKSFEIQAFRQFILHFGSKNDFFAYVTVDGGEPIEIAGDKAKREAYKQLAPRGARLKDFVGFWTLGLDMLPWNDHTMRLHVQRDCNCTMEAWFIRPTDTEPVDPKKLSRGSAGTSCTRVNRTETRHIVPLNNTLKADHLILIRVLTNEHFRSVFFELNATDSEQGPLMECYLHTEPDLSSIRLRDSETQDNATTTPIYDLLPKSNNNSQIEFMIVLTGYSYGIVMNGQLLDGLVFFPPKWWKGLPFDNMTSLRVRGSFFLLSEPTVMAFDTIQQNYKLPQIPIPFNQTVDRLGINSFLRFLVKPHDKFTNFNISLLHDRPVEYDEYLGATVLTMQVQPDKIILSTFYKGDTTNSQSFPSVNTQAAMEFKIEVDSNFFIIYKNDTGLVAFPRFLSGWATNFVRVGGDVSLLAPVFYERAEGLIAGYIQNHTVKLKTLLTSEDVIHIVVRIKKSDSFSILLMHESWEWSDKIGDVVLGLSFNSKSPGSNNYTFRCGYYLHHEHGNNDVMLNKVPKMKGHGDPTDLNLNYNGQRFQIAISCNDTASAFLVDIVDVGLNHSCPYPTTKGKSGNVTTIPPWAVDHIRVQNQGPGQVIVHTLYTVNYQPLGPKNFTEIDKSHGMLRSGDWIAINVTTLPQNNLTDVTVNLFYEALKLHDIIGKAVMQIWFNGKTLEFNSSKNGSEDLQKCDMGTFDSALALTELHFKILVTDAGFTVTLNNNSKPCTYHDGLPTWAVQYITVEQNGVMDNPTIICHPEKRCMCKPPDKRCMCKPSDERCKEHQMDGMEIYV